MNFQFQAPAVLPTEIKLFLADKYEAKRNTDPLWTLWGSVYRKPSLNFCLQSLGLALYQPSYLTP